MSYLCLSKFTLMYIKDIKMNMNSQRYIKVLPIVCCFLASSLLAYNAVAANAPIVGGPSVNISPGGSIPVVGQPKPTTTQGVAGTVITKTPSSKGLTPIIIQQGTPTSMKARAMRFPGKR